MQRKLQFIAKFDNFRVCVRPRMKYVTTRTWNSGIDTAVSLLHFTAFFQGEDNGIERDENHYKSVHVESFSYVL